MRYRDKGNQVRVRRGGWVTLPVHFEVPRVCERVVSQMSRDSLHTRLVNKEDIRGGNGVGGKSCGFGCVMSRD